MEGGARPSFWSFLKSPPAPPLESGLGASSLSSEWKGKRGKVNRKNFSKAILS